MGCGCVASFDNYYLQGHEDVVGGAAVGVQEEEEVANAKQPSAGSGGGVLVICWFMFSVFRFMSKPYSRPTHPPPPRGGHKPP